MLYSSYSSSNHNRNYSPNTSTYVISQYEKKPLQYSNSAEAKTLMHSQSQPYHYDKYFNENYQNSIALTDYEDEERQRRQEDAFKSLLSQNEQLRHEISSMKDQIEKMAEDNATLENKLGKLTEQNEEMSNLINEQKNQIMLHQNDNERLSKRVNDLLSENDSIKEEFRNCVKQNNDLKQENMYLNNDINNLQNERDVLHQKYLDLNAKHSQMKDQFNQLQHEYEMLQNEAMSDHSNKEAIIDDLKHEVDALKNQLHQVDKEKNYFENKVQEMQKEHEKKVNDLNNKLNNLNKENERLAKITSDTKKLNTQLLRDKDNLQERLKNVENALQNALNKNRKGPSENQMLLDCLKGENYDMKELNNKYRKMMELLFKFINELNELFNHNEISIEQCKDNINELVNDLEMLKQDILNLFNSVNGNGNEENEKWNNLQDKLLNKRVVMEMPVNQNKEEEYEVGNDWKSGKCPACDLGRNVSLKGCSPFFCKKHKFKQQMKK